MEIFWYYGMFSIAIWVVISFLSAYVLTSKFWKKHLKSRKKIYFFLAFFSLVFFLISLKKAVAPFHLQILWGVHILLFLLYTVWSIKKIYTDFIRIKGIESRRK